ncbi:MAG: oxygen-independent coproporphyrinogen III oxidase [Deltaproteobacteria bacterium]|nr:oxygen-independent coproporphyrinogen III oxidase [Deltaproteobacteria bacterium]
MQSTWSQSEVFNWLQKYNVTGPRYTSYPTVPAWSESVGALDYQKALASLQPEESFSLYFHLPFCEKLCHFCGCMQVITTDHSRSQDYVKKLLQEIALVRKQIPQRLAKVEQIHFGGGTPNFLQAKELKNLFEGIHQHFKIEDQAEIAIEMHPRTSTQAFCDQLKELGFNRISLGVQDFDPKVQKLINRHQTYEQTKDMLDYLRSLGFTSFNFDLIYGLPGQKLNTWQKTLDQVLKLDPDRLAVYSYAHVPWIKPVQRSFQDSDLPNPETKLKLFEMALKTFPQAGYELIGMDHFAKAQDELSLAKKEGSLHRNFMGYSTRAEAHQIGFGVSSISYVGGHYFQNQKQLPDYEKSIQSDNLATFRGCLLSQEDQIRRDLITQIMCLGEINFKDFEKKWSLDFKKHFASELKQLEALQQDGLLEIKDQKINCTPIGQLFLRIIAMVFDPYLEKIKTQAKNPTFSKTV